MSCDKLAFPKCTRMNNNDDDHNLWNQKRRKIYPKVKGEDLLLKIEKITGSKDLTIYNGSLQKLAIECGFLRDVEKYWKEG